MLVAVVIVLVVVVGVGAVVLNLSVQKKRSTGADEVRGLLGGDEAILVFDDKAICRGTESGPFNNLVGMGSLGLNDTELVFLRWAPREEVHIPRADIVGHVFTTTYLGKDSKVPLLQVTYRNAEHTEGETPGEDLIAWQVTDPDAWNAALKG